VFVQKLLLQTHPAQSLGPNYFVGLIEATDTKEDVQSSGVPQFAMTQLGRFDVSALERDVLRRLLLRLSAGGATTAWIEEGRLQPSAFGLDFLKALAFHPDWEADPWLASLRRDGPDWARELTFDEDRSERVLGWLR